RAEAEREAAYRKAETSRLAGMAEVATGVLHNVGNVLNSVNVSATLVVEQVRNSKAAFVPKLATMLQEHSADLGHFLTADPKGRVIPRYLAALGEDLLAERQSVASELQQLSKNIEHIRDIVAMQQSYAKVSGVAQNVGLHELVDDALRMNAGALTRHEIEVVRDYRDQPTVTVDRHKVMQILVNLIRNAKYACDDSGRSEKIMTLRITREQDRVQVVVSDNGVGIPAENLTRIFAHGFTTRETGHGFGLHSGALVAKELGGALTVQSDGPGLGASFTLELPLVAGKVAA
ncbi:MAG TPA: ATP-binding protein, partial [Candidatus Synoicihabitans sp.]|nr:ATP-binding protein [Candidatus Synoicihabitans sp.]